MRRRASFVVGLSALLMLFLVPVFTGSPAGAYPITTCSTLSVSTTNPSPGEAITVGGSNFTPNASVTLVLQPGNLTFVTATADANGSFSVRAALPDSTTNNGHYNIVATSGSGRRPSCPVDPYQTLAVQAETLSHGGTATGTGASGGGGLSVSGLDVAGLLALAAALIGAGVLLNRRKTGVGGR